MSEVWTMGEMIVEIMRPDAGMELNKAGLFKGPYPSGAPAIFIDTVARLGHSAGIIGGVGDDDFGKCLTDRMKEDGVNCSKILVDASGTTGVAFVTYFEDGSRKFIYHIGNTPAVLPKAPSADDLEGIKFFHVMGCSLMADKDFAKEIVKTVHLAKSLGAKISFDPNIRPELMKDPSVMTIVREVFENTSVFMPGVDELLLLTDETDIEKAVEKCFQIEGFEILTLKRGSKGCSVYTKTETSERGVFKIKPVDATGAGDSFDGAFICGLLENKPLDEIIDQASAAGALNTSAFGPMEGDISPETVKNMIETGERG